MVASVTASVSVASVAAPVAAAIPTLKELKAVLGRYNDDWRMIHVDVAGAHSASNLAAARAREQATVDDAIRLSPVFRALSAPRQVALLTSGCIRSIAAEGALIGTLSSAEWRAFQDARVAAEEEEAAAVAAAWDAQADWVEWNSRYD